MKNRLSWALYHASLALLRAVLAVVARWEVDGRARVPADGPAILIANHVHLVDPPLIAAASPRRLRPMAKRELFENRLFGWFFWVWGAFPVRRFSGDTGALRAALTHLRDGNLVLMFPEGTRSKSLALQPALPGAAMVALMAHVPVVPVAIIGSNIRLKFVFLQWLIGRRPHIRVIFGEPFTLDQPRANGHAAEEATDRMMRQIAALLPESMQGVYGEHTMGTTIVRRQGRETRQVPSSEDGRQAESVVDRSPADPQSSGSSTASSTEPPRGMMTRD